MGDVEIDLAKVGGRILSYLVVDLLKKNEQNQVVERNVVRYISANSTAMLCISSAIVAGASCY